MGISTKQALDCFRSDDLVGIGMEADAVRRRLHPEGVVSYAISAEVNWAMMASRTPDAAFDAMCETIAEAVDRSATGVRLRDLAECTGIDALLRSIRGRFPAIWIEGLSAVEVRMVSAGWGLGLRDTIARLTDVGLDSIAGDGVALVDGAVEEWVQVHRVAHGLGMRTVAGMVFGAGETVAQRVELLEMLRRLQEETGGFAAFAPVAAEAPGGRELDGVTAVERLKTLAIARMFLDNIENVQMCGSAQQLKVLQMGLRFGANDVGRVATSSGDEEDVRRIIRDAGFKPVERDMAYRVLLLA